MSDDRILYQRTSGNRMYRIVPGDVSNALVKELFDVECWEDGEHMFTSGAFPTVDAAKKRITENINNVRASRLRHAKDV
jgi:hypothetical protein